MAVILDGGTSKSCVAIIPARGGSVRLPRKNIRLLGGRPVICYAIEAARQSDLFREVIVSTDDDEISEIAQHHGANVWRRPPDDGTRGTNEVAAEVLRTVPDVVYAAVIYPCAAMLLPFHLVGMASIWENSTADFIIATYPDDRRDAGAAYYGSANAFRESRPMAVGLPNCLTYRFIDAIDVNDEKDWQELEAKWPF